MQTQAVIKRLIVRMGMWIVCYEAQHYISLEVKAACNLCEDSKWLCGLNQDLLLSLHESLSPDYGHVSFGTQPEWQSRLLMSMITSLWQDRHWPISRQSAFLELSVISTIANGIAISHLPSVESRIG